MFAARAGLSGNASYSGILGRRKRKKKKQAFHCWVPFVWQAFVAVIAGLVVMAAGIALCVVGYYAGGAMSAVDLFRDYKSDQVDIANNDTWSRNVTMSYLHNLTYVGPMLMGCGCFSTVIACVVVCETRDKQLKALALREANNPRRPKMDVCERIVRYVIAKCKDRKQRRQRNSGTSAVTCRLINADPDVEQHGQVTRDSCIAVALKTIPTSLFAVDCDRRRLTSMAPVNVSGDMPCRKIVSVMSLPCIFVENTDSCSVNTKSSEQSAAHLYEHFDRFQSKHHSRQPCMYHDKQLWSFDIASGRNHATREESYKKASPVGEHIVTSNCHATSACDDSGWSNGESGRRKNLGFRTVESLKHSSIPHIAITAIDGRQVAAAGKTATVIVHQAAVSVDGDDVTKDKSRRLVSDSDQRTAVFGYLANGTRDVPVNHCYVTSTLDRDGAVAISQGLVRSTSSVSDGETRKSSLYNHAYVI